jgi:DNA-binding response OmpR family regulator
VPKILVSNNSELLRHLSLAPFRRLNIELVVVSSGDEVLDSVRDEKPGLAILDAELPGLSGYDAAKSIREQYGDCKVVLVVGKRMNSGQMQRVAASGCHEVVVAPMSADELFDIVAIQLGLPRRGAERFNIDLAVITNDGERAIDGRVTNLSLDGTRLVLPEPIADGTGLRLTITPDGEEEQSIEIEAQVVWSHSREGATVVGAAFAELAEPVRGRLARLTQWEIVDGAGRTRVVLKGDITEATNFKDLLPAMIGRIDFDLSQVGYINSLGVREWVNFLKESPIQGYEFHACSIAFVLQASLVPDVLGRGNVASFFAPYHCELCEYSEERLLQTATILATEDHEPPVYTCPSCDDDLVLDDIPERYLAFLRDDD